MIGPPYGNPPYGHITIPAGETRGMVFDEGRSGFLGYGCDGSPGGIFYINPNLVEETTVVPTHPDREGILDLIANFPNQDSTDEEKKQWNEAVIGTSVNVNVLEISGCMPEPPVLEVGPGESIEIKNSDEVARTLLIGPPYGHITIPAGGTRGMVFDEGRSGFLGYGCDDSPGGIFYINPNLVVEPSEKQRYITFKVVEFLFPDGSNGPALVGVTVTTLDGESKPTLSDGSVTFKRDLPFIVQLEKEGYITTEATVLEHGEAIVLPSQQQKNISFRVVEPLLPTEGQYGDWPDYRNGPGIAGVTVTCLEGSDDGIKETDPDGNVSFFGTPPLTVRIEKEGYITTEATVGIIGSEIVFPNAWPAEVGDVIRRLGLEDEIASGWLTLRWGDEEYLEKTYDGHVGGLAPCPNIIVRKFENRELMIHTLIHEMVHIWQSLNSNTRPSCALLYDGWERSEVAKAWIAVTEKDIKENGPIPDFDDKVPHNMWKPLWQIPAENQASFFPRWYMGPAPHVMEKLMEKMPGWSKEKDLKMLYELAPNRCQYLEDRFGPPPR